MYDFELYVDDQGNVYTPDMVQKEQQQQALDNSYVLNRLYNLAQQTQSPSIANMYMKEYLKSVYNQPQDQNLGMSLDKATDYLGQQVYQQYLQNMQNTARQPIEEQTQNKGFWGNLVQTLTKPFVSYGGRIGESLSLLGSGAKDILSGNAKRGTAKLLTAYELSAAGLPGSEVFSTFMPRDVRYSALEGYKPSVLSEDVFQKYVSPEFNMGWQNLKDLGGIASWFVPATGIGNMALAGAMQGVSDSTDYANAIEKALRGATGGALFGGATNLAGKALSGLGKSIMPGIASKLEESGQALGRTAIKKAVGSNVPKSLASRLYKYSKELNVPIRNAGEMQQFASMLREYGEQAIQDLIEKSGNPAVDLSKLAETLDKIRTRAPSA